MRLRIAIVNEDTKQENIKNFVDIATNYCQLIDNHQNLDRLFFLDELNKILPMLYYRSLFLPSSDLDESVEEKKLESNQYSKLMQSLKIQLEDWIYYFDVFNPNDLQETKSIRSNLADDLADIYLDLKLGLNYWIQGTTEQQFTAIWHWRFCFWAHTGQHITGAIRSIFWRLSENDNKF